MLPFEDVPTAVRYGQLVSDAGEIGRLLQNLLLYDRLVIPTVDLIAVPLLACWIGPENLVRALKRRRIQLVRYRGAIGYAGAGEGLQLFELRSSISSLADRQLLDLNGVPADEALHSWGTQVGGVFPDKVKWKDIEKAALANLLEIQSTEFASVADYTYREVLGSEWLRAYFALRNRNLTQLHGIAPNQLRWHLARNMNDEIDALLHLAQFNFECYLADQTGARDQTAGPAGGSVLAQRLERLVGPTRSATALSTILQLNQVPDLAIAAGDDALMNRILRQSSSRECRQFRAWFHENVASDPAGAATAYVSALDLPAPASRTSTKALRFAALTIVPTVVGAALPEIGALISTGVGVTAGAADAFVLDRLINRFAGPASPKLMIDSLRSAFDERQSR